MPRAAEISGQLQQAQARGVDPRLQIRFSYGRQAAVLFDRRSNREW